MKKFISLNKKSHLKFTRILMAGLMASAMMFASCSSDGGDSNDGSDKNGKKVEFTELEFSIDGEWGGPFTDLSQDERYTTDELHWVNFKDGKFEGYSYAYVGDSIILHPRSATGTPKAKAKNTSSESSGSEGGENISVTVTNSGSQSTWKTTQNGASTLFSTLFMEVGTEYTFIKS